MEALFQAVNKVFEFIVPISDFLWDFPTNFDGYANIPILGKFSLAVLLLLGSGIFFTFRLRFIQVTHFYEGIRIMIRKKVCETGVSPLTAFMISSAMRVGPGNIMGVTGAISVGGPGAMFWMWLSAFFGMSTAFSEAVLAQLFKKRVGEGDSAEYCGGMPYYGQIIFGNKRIIGIILSVIFIMYSLFGIPGLTFHMFTSIGSVMETIAGHSFDRMSTPYVALAIILVAATASIVIGGLKRIAIFADIAVPVMAIVYCSLVTLIIILNIDKVPYFFQAVFSGMFTPQAVFGGAFGVVLSQGIRRGLMSNEAGQGTITLAASVADNDHPAEQGFIQAIGVFLDTMIICTMTGMLVVMAHAWTGDAGVAWDTIKDSKLTVYLTSIQYLVPGTALDGIVQIILSLCYAMFAFTSLIGLILFAEISANNISPNRSFIMSMRLSGALLFVPFGALTVLAGYELGNLWYISDFTNIMVVYANVPALLTGSGIIIKVVDHYIRTNGAPFLSSDIGIETSVWTKERLSRVARKCEPNFDNLIEKVEKQV